MIISYRKAACAALLATAVLAGCSDDDDDNGGGCNNNPTGPGCVVGSAVINEDIAADRTLHNDTTYTLSGFIKVTQGATLTIEPGTAIQGDFDVPGSSLFVLRGAKIRAMGTANAPIVFTSSRDEGQREPGDWGGLIVVGNGSINRTAPPDIVLEGTGNAPNNPAVPYSGGSDNNDDSGELHYVRVEFAGFATATDQELNSFTIAAVGSGTEMDHLQALAGLDDSFEFFGGAVDAKYLVSYEAGDDHFDISEGYVGRLQYLIGYQSTRIVPRAAAGSPSTDPQGIENDGCNGAGCTGGQNATPLTVPMVANFTLVGTGPGVVDATQGGIGMMLRRGVGGVYVNGVVARWPRAAISLRDQTTLDRIAEGNLVVQNLYLTEDATVFQPQLAPTPEQANPPVQGGEANLPLAANNIEVAATGGTAVSLFAALPVAGSSPTDAAALDWSLVAGAAAATGGVTNFTGLAATKAGGFVTGTPFRGAAAAGGDKWWQGWTYYARQ